MIVGALIRFLLLTSLISPLIHCKTTRVEGFTNRSALSYFGSGVSDIVGKEENQYKSVANAHSNKVEESPKNQHPFIFFHQRKAGGSSLRQTMNDASYMSNYSSFIPCHNNVSCDTYHFPKDEPVALYAGHFPWGNQYVFHRFGSDHHRDHFSCITNFREPVSRIVSCIEFRFGPIVKKHGCVADIRVNELLELLLTKKDRKGNSCLNEPFRIMSSISDENIIDDLGILVTTSRKGKRATIYEITPKFTAMEEFVLRMTLHNVAKCGVVVLEEPRNGTDLLLKRRFPDLYGAGAFEPISLLEQHRFDHCPPPRADQIQIMEKLSAYERILYDIVVKQHRDILQKLV